MELLEERSASRIGDRRDGSSDRPRSRWEKFGREGLAQNIFLKPEAVGCHGHDHDDGGHSGEAREQEQELGSRIGVAIATLASLYMSRDQRP